MYSALMAFAILSWFTILVWIVMPRDRVPLVCAKPWLPILVLAAFLVIPLMFLVSRKDGTELLEEGLSTSNLLTIGITATGALYCAIQACRRPAMLMLVRDRTLFPFYLFVFIALLSASWSIVPTYTIYRSIELGVMFTLAVLALDRPDFERSFLRLGFALLAAWTCERLDILMDTLPKGIIFSSAKDNAIPALCLALLLVLAMNRHVTRWRMTAVAVVTVAFIGAGSAATVGAIPLIFTGLMAASSTRWLRYTGIVASIVWMAAFIVLLAGLSNFPALMELISAALQKPIVELEKATGRGQFWPLFLEAMADRNIGAGYAAGERFIQLLLDPATVAQQMGRERVFISSAHNMLVGAWVATGWLGLLSIATCLSLAWREAMRLDLKGRRYCLPMLLLLTANGMTTPGMFGEFNLHTLCLASVLVCIRSRLARNAVPLRRDRMRTARFVPERARLALAART